MSSCATRQGASSDGVDIGVGGWKVKARECAGGKHWKQTLSCPAFKLYSRTLQTETPQHSHSFQYQLTASVHRGYVVPFRSSLPLTPL